MFRELLYIGVALGLFVGILLLFQSFDAPNGALTGFAVRENQQNTPSLAGNIPSQEQELMEQTARNQSAEQLVGDSAQFQVQVRVVSPSEPRQPQP